MFITPSFKKSLIVEQFRGNYLKGRAAPNSPKLPPDPEDRRNSGICFSRISNKPVGISADLNDFLIVLLEAIIKLKLF